MGGPLTSSAQCDCETKIGPRFTGAVSTAASRDTRLESETEWCRN